MSLPRPSQTTIEELLELLWPLDNNGNKLPEEEARKKDSEFFRTVWDVKDTNPYGLRNKIYLDQSFQSPFRWKDLECQEYFISLTDGHATSFIHFADVYKCMKLAESKCPNGKGSQEWMDTLEYFTTLWKMGFVFVIIDGNNRGVTKLLIRLGIIPLPAGTYYNQLIDNAEPWTYTKPVFWRDLSTSHRTYLMGMPINIMILEKTSRRNMSKYFNRINMNSGLNRQEIRNSWYAEIAELIRQYARQNSQFFNAMAKTNGYDPFRRDHEELLAAIAVLLSAQIYKLSVKPDHIDDAYGNNVEKTTPQGDMWYTDTEPFLNRMRDILVHMPKALTKTYVIDFVNFMRQHSEHEIIDYKGLAQRLYAAYDDVRENKTPIWEDKNGSNKTFKEISNTPYNRSELMECRGDSFLTKFYDTCYDKKFGKIEDLIKPKSSTKAIVEDDGIKRDPQRIFSLRQRYLIWLNQKMRTRDGSQEIPLCEIFNSKLWQADHITEWDLGIEAGGVTTVENGQLISPTEHSKKSAKYMAEKRAKASEKTLAQAA